MRLYKHGKIRNSKKILICADYYLPGYKAGGPIKSISNIVSLLQDDFEISIYTRDKDFGDDKSYSSILSDTWHRTAGRKERVFYNKIPGFYTLYKLTRNESYDIIYLNSIYSKSFTIPVLILNYLGLINSQVVLCPRGELNKSARMIKKRSKLIYLSVLKHGAVLKSIRWHSTSADEEAEIQTLFGKHTNRYNMPNIPEQRKEKWNTIDKNQGTVKLVMVSRVAPIKNIEFLLTVIKDEPGFIDLHIYGPIEDKSYFNYLMEEVSKLPENIKVSFYGATKPSDLPGYIKECHYFISPTKGENFGHSIYDSLLCSRPVIISDRTPWSSLEKKGVGHDLSLDDIGVWQTAVREIVNQDQKEFDSYTHNAFSYAEELQKSEHYKSNLLELFTLNT